MTDDRLIALEAEYDAHISAADEYAGAKETDEACDKSFGEATRAAVKIIRTKAVTVEGCAIQLRVAFAHADFDTRNPYGPHAGEYCQFDRDFIDAVRSVLATLDGLPA